MLLRLCYVLLVFLLASCATRPQVKKERSESKTEFTIPANSVFSFEKGELKVSEPTKLANTTERTTSTVDTSAIVANAKAATLSRFYIFGGILALIGAFLLWRTHGKAGWVAIAGALGCPILARYYNSEAAQNFALASLCIAGALFAAWHVMKRRGLIREDRPGSPSA